jgi:excisionase family DNA binding protein
MTIAERTTLTVAETAELLGISRWLVQQAVRNGSLPSRRVGRRILIPRIRLDAWLAGQDGVPDSAALSEQADDGSTSRRTAS